MEKHSQTNGVLTSAEMVLDTARKRAAKRKPVVAVAGAEDADVLKAVNDSNREGIFDALLVGDGGKIRLVMQELELE